MPVRASVEGRILTLLFVVGLRVLENILYFKKFGPLSSPAADIWYFMGVARGHQHLFPLDPLQWILPLFGSCETQTLFVLLLVLSNGLHLLTVVLLFGLLREAYREERAALWAAVAYGCFHTSCLFCTGSFHHQQVVLPVLIGAMWSGCRFLNAKEARRNAGIALALLGALGLCIGPDALVLLVAAVPCGAAWHFRNRGAPAKRLLVGTLLLGCFAGGVILLGPWFQKLAVALASNLRGINLAAQRELNVGDLIPFTGRQFWAAYFWFGLVLIVMVCRAWLLGRWIEIAFLLTALLFAARAGRFYFVVEIGLVILAGWMLARDPWLARSARVVHVAGGLLVLALLATEIQRGFLCLCPGMIPSVLFHVRKDARPEKKILCTPTHGFIVREASGAKPTSDMHHLNGTWMELAVKPAGEAVAELKKRGVTHIFFTSHDFEEAIERMPDGRWVVGTYCSGGLERHLPRLSQDMAQRSLVAQVFTPSFQTFPIKGLKLLSAVQDRATRLKIVLYRLD